MQKKIVFFYLFLSALLTSELCSTENFYNLDYEKDNLTTIQKAWTYKSGYIADSQTKPISYDDKIIHLDGHKNLHTISIETGKLICKNIIIWDNMLKLFHITMHHFQKKIIKLHYID